MVSLPPRTPLSALRRRRSAGMTSMPTTEPGSTSGRDRIARASAEKSVMYGATRSTSRARPSRGVEAATSHSPSPSRAPSATAITGMALR